MFQRGKKLAIGMFLSLGVHGSEIAASEFASEAALLEGGEEFHGKWIDGVHGKVIFQRDDR